MRPRVGHIQFLNSLPLYHMLLKDGSLIDIDLCKDTPVELCNRLLQGRLDISPVPAIEYARHADELKLLPGLAVASDGPVMSIVLVTKAPLEELGDRPVALTNTSRTSQVLAKIVLKEKYGVQPEFFSCPPDLPEMFREADAALLIGDDALRVFAKPGKYLLYDLGSEWKDLTGDRMVYAVWAVRNEYAAAEAAKVQFVWDAFQRSIRMTLDHVKQIARDSARWETFSAKFLEEYFRTLRFAFDEPYQQGLMRYYRMAAEIGELEKVPELDFVSVQ